MENEIVVVQFLPAVAADSRLVARAGLLFRMREPAMCVRSSWFSEQRLIDGRIVVRLEERRDHYDAVMQCEESGELARKKLVKLSATLPPSGSSLVNLS